MWQEVWVQSLGWAPSMGSQRLGHCWVTNTHSASMGAGGPVGGPGVGGVCSGGKAASPRVSCARSGQRGMAASTGKMPLLPACWELYTHPHAAAPGLLWARPRNWREKPFPQSLGVGKHPWFESQIRVPGKKETSWTRGEVTLLRTLSTKGDLITQKKQNQTRRCKVVFYWQHLPGMEAPQASKLSSPE